MTNSSRQIPLFLGTMGFSYKDWNGVFYPAEMDSRDYLSYYSRIFRSVEIDSTFYGTPKKSTIQRWVSETPANFKFSLKVPRMITHDLGLVNASGLMAEFLEVVSLLGDRLGVLLLQFPPSFKADQLDKLSTFLARLSGELRFAVEVRDGSWYADESLLLELLKAHNIAWAATQYPNLPGKIQRGSYFIYLRWIGRHGSFQNHDHERIDRTADLQNWWEQIQNVNDELTDLFGYFNNDYAGFAAGTALKFKTMVGDLVDFPQQPRQARLF